MWEMICGYGYICTFNFSDFFDHPLEYAFFDIHFFLFAFS